MAQPEVGGGQPPASSGRPRSDRTREAIVRAAREQFSKVGYERATIRAVAAHADIDPAMVMRYYGSKAGLFAAAADIELRLPDLRQVPRERLGEVLAGHFLDRWGGDLADDALIVLLRTAVTNEPAAARLRSTFADQVVGPIAAALEDRDALHRAAMVGTQLLGTALFRFILRIEPIASLPAGVLVADLAPTLQRYLTGPLAGVRDSPGTEEVPWPG